jgi:LysM repeat protein
MKFLWGSFLFFISFSCIAQKEKAYTYIEKYKNIAMAEMQRTGVPASISLAQGILESNYGESELCKNSNNHFGIKCKIEWQGEKVFADDDEQNECFRKYMDATESYKDHSNFLKTRAHYAFLFNLDPTDFEGWAYGLKKAGYATEKTYAERIIGIINNYNLNSYTLLALDKNYIPKNNIVDNKEIKNNTKTIATTVVEDEKDIAINKNSTYRFNEKSIKNTDYPKTVFEINGSKVIYAEAGTSLLAIANQNNVSYNKLISYNDLEDVNILEKDQLIFLEKKQKKGIKDFHIVTKGESLYDIAQKEGVRLDILAEYNGLNKNIFPLVGETIYLRTKALVTPKFNVAKITQTNNSTTN